MSVVGLMESDVDATESVVVVSIFDVVESFDVFASVVDFVESVVVVSVDNIESVTVVLSVVGVVESVDELV